MLQVYPEVKVYFLCVPGLLRTTINKKSISESKIIIYYAGGNPGFIYTVIINYSNKHNLRIIIIIIIIINAKRASTL